MTTDNPGLPFHEDPTYRRRLEEVLAADLQAVQDYAAGRSWMTRHDFEAALVVLRHTASELRWLTLGEQPVPF